MMYTKEQISNKNKRTTTGNVLLFLILIALISACSPISKKKALDENNTEIINQQVFLIGNGPNSKKTISDMIEKSGIRRGGFVVILPMPLNKPDSSAYSLQKEFYDQQIMAVHILDFDDNFQQDFSAISIKNSDVLAIENASIICLLSGRKNKFMKLANNTHLKKALQNAKAKGTLIAGTGNGASVLGDIYYTRVRDTISNEFKILMKPGLGLLKNTVVNDITLLKSNSEGIQQNSTKKKFMFIGLGYKSAVWIKNGEVLVLRKPEISLVSPDASIRKLGKGDKFGLIAQ